MKASLTIWSSLSFVVLWVGLAIALATEPDRLSELYDWLQGLHMVPRVVLWVLLLPIVFGLWCWETGSGRWRTAGLVVLAVWTFSSMLSLYQLIDWT